MFKFGGTRSSGKSTLVDIYYELKFCKRSVSACRATMSAYESVTKLTREWQPKVLPTS